MGESSGIRLREEERELDRGEWETQRENPSVRSSYTRLLFRATIGGRDWERSISESVCGQMWACNHIQLLFFILYIMLVTLNTRTVNLLYLCSIERKHWFCHVFIINNYLTTRCTCYLQQSALVLMEAVCLESIWKVKPISMSEQ